MWRPLPLDPVPPLLFSLLGLLLFLNFQLLLSQAQPLQGALPAVGKGRISILVIFGGDSSWRCRGVSAWQPRRQQQGAAWSGSAFITCPRSEEW